MHYPLLTALAVLSTGVARGGPGVSVGSQDGPRPGTVTYKLTLDRPNAERLRDALLAADVKRAGDVLTAAAKDPAEKLAAGLAASNVDAFRKRLAEEGAIGPNGVEIRATATVGSDNPAPLIPGRVDKEPPGPLKLLARKAGRRAAEIVLNPWSWEVRPRE